MGCFCSIDQSSDTPSSSSPPPPPPPTPPQPPQWNSPPALLIPPQPHPPPLQSSPAEQMPRCPQSSPLLIPTVQSASPRLAPIYWGSAVSCRVLIEPRGGPPPSPHRVPIEQSTSPPPSSRCVPTEWRSSPLPSDRRVLIERRGRPLPSPLRVPIERIASPPSSSRHVPTKRSTSLLSSPRRVPIARNTSPPPGGSSLFEPFFSPSVAASSSSAPSAEMKKHSQNFTFHDLAIATENFSNANFLGEGGFGNVYKGKLNSGEVVAVKVLRKMGVQGNKEFLTEVLMLTMLKHPNLIGLVGFCSEGDQRLLVYEFMPNGTLLDHLFDLPPNREPLDWTTRIKIILGVANGLHYLHDLADPPVIYRDMKAENILLDDDFNPKLSDFGLTKLAPAGDEAYVFTRILENQGYCDPEYVATGKLSKKSDVYSFGILMLELISGRIVYDETAPRLLAWASACLSNRKLYVQLVDPLLLGCFRRRSLNILAPVIGFCTNYEPCLRPPIKDVVKAVANAASFSYDSESSTPSTTSSESSASL
ncbi:probable serine/threonine-protein kinase PBL21 isoform X2 [Ananas comosus]|uniref:Probable serine/threonine-protein kinase PBL21 isoform X2 n=1 Tax=Ananas comosus TaxID=4615 RepID=A0A6P5FCE7_ANACO|nr:probable serine/threonine-protein kinase PBL21 isoform X2 [Ananas comosus]